MVLAMVRPTKHPKTGVYRIRLVVPKPLRDITHRLYGVRCEFIRSLGTKVDRDARAMAPAVVDEFQGKLKAAEAEHTGKAVRLSDRQVSVLCGRWLATQEAAAHDDIPEPLSTYAAANDFLSDVLQGEEDDQAISMAQDAEQYLQADIAALLGPQGLHVDRESRRRLVTRLAHVKWLHARDMLARADTGQWRPTVQSGDFAPNPVATKAWVASTSSIDDLLDGWGLDHGWRRDARPISRAFYDRLRTMERLAAFLGHRDASRVAKDDVVRWKVEMQTRDLNASTVRNDLSEMSAIWKWGLAHDKVQTNPFAGILPPKAVRKARDPRAFTPEEIKAILTAARGQEGLLRWMPWLLCLTGARLNEACQSTRDDVVVVDGVQCIRIHDEGEGRSVKNADSRRIVPLHPALIAEGFLNYVAKLPAGSTLWPDVSADPMFGRQSGPAGRKVSRWLKVELTINDKRISPNHSWRHTFVEACRRVVMPLEVRSAITGHSARMDESAGYGAGMGTMIQVIAEHLARIPAPLAQEP